MTSPSASTDNLARIYELPSLVGADGQTYTATRFPKLKDGLAYFEAVETQKSFSAMLRGARQILVSAGIPEAVVDDLEIAEVTEAANRFFLAKMADGAS